MNDSGLRYPKWQTPLQEALVEFDPEKLVKRIENAELAVFERLQELSSDSDHQGEREAIADALSLLRMLKQERLSFPDWG